MMQGKKRVMIRKRSRRDHDKDAEEEAKER